MANLNTENLFLLEFLVDSLQMNNKCNCMGQGGEICVSFQFLDNEALDVCEGDFDGDMKFGENDNKTGKSCLFSLTPAQAQKVLQSFDVTVNVLKKMQPGWEPEKTCIGSVKVSVLNLYMDLITNKGTGAQAKVLQDTYQLTDTTGTIVGKIGVYIRMSCYGKMIITQFQMNMDDKSVLFKDKDGQSLYRYKKSKRGKTTKIEDLSSKQQPSCFPPQGYGSNQMMFGQNQYGSTYPSRSTFPSQNMSMGMTMQPNFGPMNPNCPTQPCFPDFGQQDMRFMSQQAGGRQSRSACGRRGSRI